MKAGQGKYDAQAIGALLSRHNQEVQACYERALAANPSSRGPLGVNLDADQNGMVKGVSTQPNGGARTWRWSRVAWRDMRRRGSCRLRANGKGAPGIDANQADYNMAPKK